MLQGSVDHRGGSQSSFTEEVLQRYILDTYDNKYSCEWIRQILHKLGHSHKRSAKRSTRANKEAQEAFKKGLLH